MADLKLVGQAQLITIKRLFKKDVGVDIIIYGQEGNLAPDDVTLSSIRTKRPDSSEIKIVGQTLVKNVERFFEKNYGVKIDILNGDGSLADNNSTLGVVKRTYSDATLHTEEEENTGKEINPKQAEQDNVFKIAVRFPLTSGDGEIPTPSILLEEEKKDIASICKFNLYYEPDQLDESEYDNLRVLDCQVVYDGVTKIPLSLKKERIVVGYEVDEKTNELTGYPTPIVIFSLNMEIDPEDFLMTVNTSSVTVLSSNMDDPFYAEDDRGNTQVVEDDEVTDLVNLLKEHGCYSGKHYSLLELQRGVLCSEIRS